MKERCPGSVRLGVGSLDGYELAFTIYSPTRRCGCADVVPRAGGKVFGLLYELTEDDAVRLDEAEGVGGGHYRRISVEVTSASGGRVRAETYEVVHKRSDCPPPSEEYLSLLVNAAERFGFPEEYARKLKDTKTGIHG